MHDTALVDLRRLAKTALNVAKTATLPPLEPPGHYYSPLTSPEDNARAIAWAKRGDLPLGVQMDLQGNIDLAERLAPHWAELRLSSRYHPDVMYGVADAAVYHSILREYDPPHIVEVGSGYSTAVAFDTIEHHGLEATVTCVEPHPERLKRLLRPEDDVTLHESLVQDAPMELFTSLGDGDILFLDSTHVVKSGSDVVWTTLHVLPLLAPGVLVHVHDMFWPLEYQEKWLRERRDWNEIYLIHAFLSGNPQWEIALFSDYVWQKRPDLPQRYRPETATHRPGGLWLRKIG
jgi:predicted O-methyltransferase YrrM